MQGSTHIILQLHFCPQLQAYLLGGKSVYFFVVWSFLLFGLFGWFLFAVWAGACFFLLFGRGRAIFFAVWAGSGTRVFFFAVRSLLLLGRLKTSQADR